MSLPTRTDSSFDMDFDDVARFGRSQRGAITLLVGGQAFVKDREFHESVNWRCAHFRRHKCRARAITRHVDGRLRVRVSHAVHTHAVAGGGNEGDSTTLLVDGA